MHTRAAGTVAIETKKGMKYEKKAPYAQDQVTTDMRLLKMDLPGLEVLVPVLQSLGVFCTQPPHKCVTFTARATSCVLSLHLFTIDVGLELMYCI